MASKPEFSTDRFALRLALFYAAYFLFGGIQWPYFPVWLEAKGLDASTIGLVIAAPMIVRIVFTPVATHLADRYAALKAAIVILSAGGTLAMAVLGQLEGGIAILIAFVIATMFFSPTISIAEAYALNGLRARGRAYGPVRLWGSVAFIAGNVGAGLLLDAIAPGNLIWLSVAALAVSTVAAVMLVPFDRGPRVEAKAGAPAGAAWCTPAFVTVAAAAALIQGSHALFYGFSTLDWRAAGFDGLTIGVLWGLGVVSEIVLFALSGRLPGWLGPTLLLAIGGIGGVVRWTAMAFDPPALLLPLLQMLHALSFGAAHLGAMGFLARAVPPERAATAQGVLATVSGIVMAAATAASGSLYAASGSLAYLAMAAMALTGLACALIAHLRSRG